MNKFFEFIGSANGLVAAGIFCLMLSAAACSGVDCSLEHVSVAEDLPLVKSGTFPHGEIYCNVGEQLHVAPELINGDGVTFKWILNGKQVSEASEYDFTPDAPGRMALDLVLSNPKGKVTLSSRIIVAGSMGNGFYVLNEGRFGVDCGSLSFYDTDDDSMLTDVFSMNNFGAVLGMTSQSATMWNGKLYICSKQESNLAVADPETLYAEKISGNIVPGMMVYEFVGIDEDWGVLTQNGYFSLINLDTYETKMFRMVGNTWSGTGSGIAYQDKLILNVKGNKLYVIEIEDLLSEDNPAYGTIDVKTSGGTRFVEGQDGCIYTVETLGGDGNNLVRISPDFSIEKKSMRSDYRPSDFGSYREDSFCGTKDGHFYYVASGRIYHATWDDASPAEAFVPEEPGMMLYGAGVRVSPDGKEIVATYVSDGTAAYETYESTMIVRYDARSGEKLGSCEAGGYLFPATVVFRQ